MPRVRIEPMTKRMEAREFLARLNEKVPKDGIASPDSLKPSGERATAILLEFGGLHVGDTGAGQDMACSDVEFFAHPMPEMDDFAGEWTTRPGQLTAIADAHHGHMTVFVGESGALYAYAHPNGALYPIGSDFGQAMERLLRGISYGPPVKAGQSAS